MLARRHFIPATILNFLAAAWIQFETHDWFNHGEPMPGNELEVPLAADDPWRQRSCPMKIRRTRPDPTRDYEREQAENGGRLKYPPTYANAESHWWDASQIYGSNHETTLRLRAERRLENGKVVPTGELVPDGKLYLDDDDLILDPNALDDRLETALTGFSGNWWAGLSLLHTLFAREHNAICDELKRFNPGLGRRPAVCLRAHGQRGPDGEDPHRRMDAGDPGASGASDRHEGQLVGAGDRAPAPRDRPHQRERGVRRHAALRRRSHAAPTTA